VSHNALRALPPEIGDFFLLFFLDMHCAYSFFYFYFYACPWVESHSALRVLLPEI
jgi:hypothetical protein